MTHKHVHVLDHEHGHEHDTRALASTPARGATVPETDSKVIRMNGASHKGNERVPQGHANPAPGVSERKGVTPGDVLRTFPGAKIVEKSVE